MTRALVVVTAMAAASSFGQEPWTAPKAEAARANPVPASPEALQKGRALFQRHCASCHGVKGKGDGAGVSVLAERTSRRPADLSDRKVQDSLSDGEVFWKLTTGLKEGEVIVMPAFAAEIKRDEDRWVLVHFFRTLKDSR